jgi:mono/diheme cytochrome c family protein
MTTALDRFAAAAGVLLALTLVAPAAAQEPVPDLEIPAAAARPAPDPTRGERLYRRSCATCHGVSGHGDGPTARFLDPAPRDFTRGVYKLRSTPTGELPTDDDLFRTLTDGVPGTAMMGWGGLPVGDRWQLVYRLQSMSARFGKPRVAALKVPEPPASFSGDEAARGAAVYVTLGCGECHGPSGRADGPAARTMVDDRNKPIRAFDFTRSWKLKAGRSPKAMYRVLHTGLDGTPMPSYAGTLSDRDSWALIAFLRSLFVDINLGRQ